VVAFIVEREGGSGRLEVTIADLAFSTRIAITDDEETGIRAPAKNLLKVISMVKSSIFKIKYRAK
jgi:hypothetical protein